MKYGNFLIGDLSGSAGNLVAASNRFGNYIRFKGNMTNVNSPDQQDVRQVFGNLAARWRLLTNAQRTDWKAYADATPVLKKGKLITLTGQMMYSRCNTFRAYNGQSVVDEGPTTAGLVPFTATSISAELGTGVTVTVDPNDVWANSDQGGLYGSLSDAQGQSINFFKAPFRRGGGIDGLNVGPILDTFIMAPRAGWADGKKVFVRLNATDAQGRIGQTQFLETTIQA